MKAIDLHVHSNKSDGTFSPKELVDHAISKNLAAIALTDHDTVDGLDETIAYCDKIFTGDGNDTGWQKVTLKFDYNSNGKRNNPKTPTHIIISAASSMYGDYFEGADGSTMYLDDIKLLYDHPDDIQAGVVAVQ